MTFPAWFYDPALGLSLCAGFVLWFSCEWLSLFND